MTDTNLLNLFTAIGSLSVGLASFLFTWRRTRVKGPNIQLVEINKTKAEPIEPLYCYNADEYISHSWKFSISYESEKKVNLQLFLQNLGDRNAFIRFDKILMIGLGDTGRYTDEPVLKGSKTQKFFFLCFNTINTFSKPVQIETDKLTILELEVPIPKNSIELDSYLLLPMITTWDHRGKKSYILDYLQFSPDLEHLGMKEKKEFDKMVMKQPCDYWGLRGFYEKLFSHCIQKWNSKYADSERYIVNIQNRDEMLVLYKSIPYIFGDLFFGEEFEPAIQKQNPQKEKVNSLE